MQLYRQLLVVLSELKVCGEQADEFAHCMVSKVQGMCPITHVTCGLAGRAD